MKIDYILKLSRLKIKDKEKRKLEKEFSSILEFVKKLQELDIKDVRPLSHPNLELKNVLREDKTSLVLNNKRKANKLLDLAPVTKGRYIKVRQVL